MYVDYKPEDGDKQSWEFDPDKVRQSDAEMIEKRYGKQWNEFRGGVLQGDSKARRVLLWHLMRRQHPHLRYEDVPDFCMGELLVEQSYPELAEMRERIEKADLGDELRSQMLAGLDVAISDAIAREEASGKALAQESAPLSSDA